MLAFYYIFDCMIAVDETQVPLEDLDEIYVEGFTYDKTGDQG